MDGGQISLGSIDTSQLDPNVRYVFDCVWLIECRFHTFGNDEKQMPPETFVSVLQADLVDGKHIMYLIGCVLTTFIS